MRVGCGWKPDSRLCPWKSEAAFSFDIPEVYKGIIVKLDGGRLPGGIIIEAFVGKGIGADIDFEVTFTECGALKALCEDKSDFVGFATPVFKENF